MSSTSAHDWEWAKFAAGDVVRRQGDAIGRTQNGITMVTCNGTTGWAYSSYLH